MTDPEQAAETDPEDMERLMEIAHQFFDLARAGETGVLAALLDAGVTHSLADAKGNSLLMLAAYHGNAETVAELARRGADVDQVNDRGQTPLAGAVFKGEPDVVPVLVAAGADPDLGHPSARESARFFQQNELGALLDRSKPDLSRAAARGHRNAGPR